MHRSLLASAAVVAAVMAIAPAATGQGQTATPSTTQTPPTLTGAISGTVVDGSTGSPLAEVIVGLVALPGTQMPASYQARQMTDAKGRFAFLNLPNDGLFHITAGKSGYLDGGYGRDSAPTDPLRSIVIANGGWIGGLRVNIWPPGVISGTVRDEGGEPVVGVIVRALARIHVAGHEDLAAGPITVTDDHGRYRIPGLLPGRYVVQVPSLQMSVPAGTRITAPFTNVPEGAIDVDDSSRLLVGRFPLPPPPVNGRAMAYNVAFHPNASVPAEASTIELTFGEDRPAVDVSLTPVPAVRVSGVVEGPPEALTNLTLRLLPMGMENLGLGAEVATTLVGANGTFTFVNVPAGSYVLDAPVTFNEFTVSSGVTTSGGYVGSRGVSMPSPPPRSGSSRTSQSIEIPGLNFSSADFRGAGGGSVVPNYSARMSLTVGAADIAGVSLRLKPGSILRGKVTVELDPAQPASQTPPRFFFIMDPANGQPGLGQPRTPGSVLANQDFEIPGIQPAEYFLRLQGSAAWAVKSIQWRGRDYATVPFDAANADEISGVTVTVTNALPTLAGTIRGSDGAVPETGLVIMFPASVALRTNRGLWSPRMTSAPMQSNGTFRLIGMPAGDYIVAAIDRSRMTTWRDPEFLSIAERQGTRITLAWGQTANQDLTMMVVR